MNLIDAADHGNREDVQAAIAAGHNLNVTNGHGQTALIRAAFRAHREIAADLIAAGANVNLTDNMGRTALIHAVQAVGDGEDPVACLAIVQALLARGANPNVVDRDGRTALTYASRNGNLGIVQALLAQGANPEPNPALAGGANTDQSHTHNNGDTKTPPSRYKK